MRNVTPKRIFKTQFLEASDSLYLLTRSTNVLLTDIEIIFAKDQPLRKNLNS